MLSIAVDISMFSLIAFVCWRGYQKRQLWLFYADALVGRLYRGRRVMRQLLGFAPLIVGWLLLCHGLNTGGLHGLAAGGVLLAMTLGLYAMRDLEEKQKWEKEECDICD